MFPPDLSRISYISMCCGKVPFYSTQLHYQFLVLIISLMVNCQILNAQASQRYSVVSSKLSFISEANLETIKANSVTMNGIIDPITRSLAFKVSNTSLSGFNTELQKDHFNENYLESDLFPYCTFSGKIIDEVDFKVDGSFQVRVKGVLTIRGIGKERIIKGFIYVKGDEIFISTDFWVPLSDYNIRIPRLVQQKIAPDIHVFVEAKMKRDNK